jgi:hypothetical protein
MFLSQMWQLLFGGMMGSMFEGVEGLGGAFAPSTFGLIGTLVVWPIVFVVFLFISAGILHLCLMLVGATADSPSGFEGTLKIVSYSQVAGVASIVPLVGGFLFAIWALILEVIGISLVHRTTVGRALMGVLIPVLVCCLRHLLRGGLWAMIAAFIASLSDPAFLREQIGLLWGASRSFDRRLALGCPGGRCDLGLHVQELDGHSLSHLRNRPRRPRPRSIRRPRRSQPVPVAHDRVDLSDRRRAVRRGDGAPGADSARDSEGPSGVGSRRARGRGALELDVFDRDGSLAGSVQNRRNASSTGTP